MEEFRVKLQKAQQKVLENCAKGFSIEETLNPLCVCVEDLLGLRIQSNPIQSNPISEYNPNAISYHLIMKDFGIPIDAIQKFIILISQYLNISISQYFNILISIS